ncbi:MAG: 30S ribosomal protein S6e [Candidatus Micrarchaeota archaeon]|nr:30S ribosomal protein S6e [Candidatus Micrarchaeota archaeon]
MKIVYSDTKTGKSAQMEITAEQAALLVNYKINDTIDGTMVGLNGAKLKITGGSDASGFPLTKGIQSANKTKVLRMIAVSGKKKGQFRRTTVRGGIVSTDTAQINAVILEYGDKPASELFPEKAKAEAAPAEEKK